MELKVHSINKTVSIPYIRVHGKGDKERIVAITDKTVLHLNAYMEKFHAKHDRDHPFFYTVIKGHMGAMSTGNVERILKKYADMIRHNHPDLPRSVYPHMVRRTRSTNLYQSGVELELLARILGHASTDTTRIYAVPSIDMMKEAMDKDDFSNPEEAIWPDDEEEMARLCGLR